MRFLANGPSIPDELLVARDEGRVVFFCGAGVSRARAGLPDFYGLTQRVLDRLGAGEDSPARQLMEAARRLQQDTAVQHLGTLVSADRVFGLLEREFTVEDVRMEVAKALQPKKGADLSAHKALVDLARGPDGIVRLVTTNFDRLFQAAAPSLKSKVPPDLPDLRRKQAFDGVVHLHGMVNEDYTGIHGEEFIVSSADFGHAYLTEGWAANFMRQLLQRFQLVFVGYGADDPPVQYLLEALGRTATNTAGIHAFHGGSADEARARWGSKGVRSIPFDTSDSYRALWETLEAWAVRARDPAAWMASVIDMARAGPASVARHERGQVAHLVSTAQGARAWVAAKPQAPAEWLFAFDPVMRFMKPHYVGRPFEPEDYIDPFDLYGLESDPVPSPISPGDHFSNREVSPSAWSAFDVQPAEPLPGSAAPLIGNAAVAPGALTNRLWSLGVWLSNVCHQPAAVWWAASRGPLHEAVQGLIGRELASAGERFPATLKRAWRLLLGAWESKRYARSNWYDFKREIKMEGWTASMADRMVLALQPRLDVTASYWGGPVPPQNHPAIGLDRLIRLEVVYPDWDADLGIPDEHLASFVRGVRWMLERATTLEAEQGGFHLRLSHPLAPDPSIPERVHSHIRGIDLLLLKYVGLYKRLHSHSTSLAAGERSAWPEDDTVFARLRMWAAGQAGITGPGEAGRHLTGLPGEAFWDSHHQRDLLVAVRTRWAELPATARSALTRKLLKGPERWDHEPIGEFKERRAGHILERVEWLRRESIDLGVDPAKLDRLRRAAPDWREEFAAGAAQSLEVRSGYVETDPMPDILLGQPLSTLVDAAEQSRGRDPGDSFRKVDPFQGYVQAKPIRALAALAARTGGPFPLQCWRTFLQLETRKADSPRFTALIAGRLAGLPHDGLGTIRHEVARWMDGAASTLLRYQPSMFRRLWDAMLNTLSSEQAADNSRVFHSSRGNDWLFEGGRSPAGGLCVAALQHPKMADCDAAREQAGTWQPYVEELLDLPGDQPSHVMAVLSQSLDWLYAKDPVWVEEHLFSRLDAGGSDTVEAFWDGFMSDNVPVAVPLYLRIKPLMLARVSVAAEAEALELANRLMAGWGTVRKGRQAPLVDDQELRGALVNGSDDFRQQVLSYLAYRSRHGKGGWKAKVPKFFKSVWPRQRAANGPRTTAAICDILMAMGTGFPKAFETVSPYLTPMDRDATRLFYDLDDLDKPKGSLVRRFPTLVLDLLSKVLPTDTRLWPYGARAILKRIGERDSALATDERMLVLLRKLDMVN